MGNVYLVRLAMVMGGIGSALVFLRLAIPLPWILGPMVWTTLLKLRYPAQVFFPRSLRNLFLIPLGYNIGAYVTGDALREIMRQLPGITLATFAAIAISVGLAFWTTRTTGVSYASSVIGNMPGGLTPMMLICENIPGADIGVVAVLQTVRLMMCIAVVPFLLAYGFGTGGQPAAAVPLRPVWDFAFAWWQLALVAVLGALVFEFMHFPSAFFVGPIITASAFSIYANVSLPDAPVWLVNIAQVTTGLYLGTFIDPFQLSKNHRLFPVCLLGAVLIVAGSLLVGYFLSNLLGFSLATAFLACAPGGVAEMSITGMALGENVPIILAYQLFRLLFLNFVMPVCLQWYFTRPHGHGQPPLSS
ncbi:MAG: AbrB family transcriptional regulator [Acidaminococcales bacterium]|jgi:membrane AbrB-like protein|nr:AbrB family transcriptional regulator [Acidaminococcales bacterium]